ncbi:hypothetical protein MyNCGM70_24670 [Achromobacter xylosoxidans]
MAMPDQRQGVVQALADAIEPFAVHLFIFAQRAHQGQAFMDQSLLLQDFVGAPGNRLAVPGIGLERRGILRLKIGPVLLLEDREAVQQLRQPRVIIGRPGMILLQFPNFMLQEIRA